MKALLFRFGLMLIIIAAVSGPLVAQAVGDTVRLAADNVQGVPVHPAAGDNTYVRWANGTVGQITAIDPGTGWFLIAATGKTGWATSRYLAVTSDEEDDDGPACELPTAVIGTWNLEWLKDGKDRGFPENTQNPSGPSYDGRTDDDYRQIEASCMSS